eukprot:1147155-Pelagomonas_calceolata.AAC.16
MPPSVVNKGEVDVGRTQTCGLAKLLKQGHTNSSWSLGLSTPRLSQSATVSSHVKEEVQRRSKELGNLKRLRHAGGERLQASKPGHEGAHVEIAIKIQGKDKLLEPGCARACLRARAHTHT